MQPRATAAGVPAGGRHWTAFCEINARRRAIRDFDGAPISDEDIRGVLDQALLAPSSGNLQPYRLHWIRDPTTRAAVSAACDGQRGAASAPVLLVVEASTAVAAETAAAHLSHVEASTLLDERSKRYHRGQLGTFRRFLRWGTLFIWTPLHSALSAVFPALTLVPLGSMGSRHWAARSAIYAAQTILLAAAARGLDSCPMEGFNAVKVTRILGLPRGTVIPIVIALGHRRIDARLEPQWRRPFASAVVVH